jgi:dipeptidyl aminopeptidase/acylaminoacyl peptidase
MTTESRLTRDLPVILGDLATGPYPDYIDDVLASSEHVRQRPAWMFPERWLPMVDIVRQPVLAARLPWRSIALVMLLVAMVVAAAAVYIGSQQRVPAPFGLARNGLIAYEAGGDIFTADPSTGAATRIVAGSATDVGPRFSLDGTRVAFERRVDATTSQLYVARSDGSNLTLVTPEPLSLAPGDSGRAWEKYEFSPDGRALLIATMTAGVPSMALAQTDGSGISPLETGMIATEPSFRPPDGKEILFIGTENARSGLFTVDTAGGRVRQVLLVPSGYDLAGASWSPDGSRIAYWSWGGPSEGLNARTHVVAANGTGDKELPSPPGTVWNAHATWSNDGTRLFIARAYTPGFDDVRGAIVPADGSSVGVEVAPAGVETTCCAAWIWSPDDSQLLGRPAGVGALPNPVIIDASGGGVRPAPWESISDPTWQRLAR